MLEVVDVTLLVTRPAGYMTLYLPASHVDRVRALQPGIAEGAPNYCRRLYQA
ncbi:hypothetical protein [Phytoactinopolyspora endophytica]|uniref:hypothetical protein n=1 Tax=Phytoactinopolyspora endophytica TaxID=1642495 RepID=UPI0013EB3FC2|nr:hypothetical protein [Phytoactinopolyspora endophytica]